MEDNFFVCAEWKDIVWNGLEGFFRHPQLFRFQIDCVTLSGCVHCNGRLWRIWRGWTCAHAGLEEFSGIPLWGTLERAPIGGRAPTEEDWGVVAPSCGHGLAPSFRKNYDDSCVGGESLFWTAQWRRRCSAAGIIADSEVCAEGTHSASEAGCGACVHSLLADIAC